MKKDEFYHKLLHNQSMIEYDIWIKSAIWGTRGSVGKWKGLPGENTKSDPQIKAYAETFAARQVINGRPLGRTVDVMLHNEEALCTEDVSGGTISYEIDELNIDVDKLIKKRIELQKEKWEEGLAEKDSGQHEKDSGLT